MIKNFVPRLPYDIPAQLLKRKFEKVNGVNQETFTPSVRFFCSAKSYGGTETTINGVYAIEDTWNIETWFNPLFERGDHIKFLDDNREYKIIASPENINRRGQYTRFKVSAIGG